MSRHPSLELAHKLLAEADARDILAAHSERQPSGYETAQQYRAEAAGLRAAANVHAITAQLSQDPAGIDSAAWIASGRSEFQGTLMLRGDEARAVYNRLHALIAAGKPIAIYPESTVGRVREQNQGIDVDIYGHLARQEAQ